MSDTISPVKRLHTITEENSARLLRVTEDDANRPLRPGAWNRKQCLGHLLDSAVNNHYRIVRALLEEGYSGPGYEQEGWVRVHAYHLLPWSELVEHWTHQNRMLAHLIAQIPTDKYDQVVCKSADDPGETTLRLRFEDYIHHLQHHLNQI